MRKLILLFLLCVSASLAQTVNPAQGVYKCYIPFYITATTGNFPSATGYDNRQDGCSNWILYYSNVGFSAVSLTVQDAPAAASNLPGTYVTFAGTVVTGSNPSTSTTQCGTGCLVLNGYYPWMRLHAALTGSGTVVGVLLGDPTPASNLAPGGTVSITQPVSVDGPDAAGAPPTHPPVLIGGIGPTNVTTLLLDASGYIVPASQTTATADGVSNLVNNPQIGGISGFSFVMPWNWDGTTWDRQAVCTNSAVINTSSSGLTQLVALAASKQIRVCHFTAVAASPVTITLDYGTGSACASGTTAMTGAMSSITTIDTDFKGELRTASANALCINLGTGVSTQGVVTYAQY